jgi:hypothetical protein
MGTAARDAGTRGPRAVRRAGVAVVCCIGLAFLAAAGSAAHAAEGAETGGPCTPLLDGLKRLPADEPVTEAALLEALTGLDVTRERTYTEGEPLTLFRVRRDGHSLLDIIPATGGGLYAVIVRDAALARNMGHELGASYRRWAPVHRNVTCEPGAEEFSGSVLCAQRRQPGLLLRFDGEWQGPDGRVPPADVLAGWTLSELIWLPGADQPQPGR